jgi:diaminopimelate epimerase
VPHLVTFDADIDAFDILEARELRYKYNANVNIASVEDDHIRVRTYERGVEDETLACGTGMAACFYRANQEGLVTDKTLVKPTSGDELSLGLEDGIITFTGDVRKIFVTEI